ncbi:MAG: S8 family serine peptidase [Gammaproteobacteria bacterium]
MHITRRPVVRRPSRVWKVTLSWAVVAAACASVAAVAGAPLKSGGRALATRPSPPVTQLIVRFHDETTSGERVAMTVPRVDGLSKAAGTQLLYRRPMAELAHVFRLREPLSQAEAEDLASRLRRDVGVASVEIDDYVFPLLDPNDPFYADTTIERMWTLKAPVAPRLGGINAPTAWDITRGAGAVVAVVDSGVFTHDDLEANILRGHDFVGADSTANGGGFLVANDGDARDADPSDPGDWISAEDKAKPIFEACSVRNSSWHGTHVAGTISAVGNNAVGMPGVAYEAKVLAVRALGKCFGYGSDITDAIRWSSGAAPATGTWASLGLPNNPNPAKVINLSLGSSIAACSTSRQSAIDAARAAGAVVVAATGNDGIVGISSPANCQGVIAVTSHTVEGDNSDFANVGPGTAISAPGGGNCSVSALNCLPQGSAGAAGTIYRSVFSPIGDGAQGPGPLRTVFGGKIGTSMATPHVSGVAALLFARMPTLKPDTVKNILTASARPFPAGTSCAAFADGRCGAGMLDARRAFDRLADLTPTVTATAPAAVVRNGSAVTLSATATPKPAGLQTLTYAWQQLSGPALTLTNPTTLQPSFTAPVPGGPLSFRFSASDADGVVGTTVVSLRANGLPVIAPPTPVTVTTNNQASFRVTATDPENDTVTFSATGLPSGATFNSTTGEFSWPSATPAGSYTLSITPNDGFENGAVTTVTVTVNDPPRGGGGSMDLLALGLLGAWWLARRGRRTRNAGDYSRHCGV